MVQRTIQPLRLHLPAVGSIIFLNTCAKVVGFLKVCHERTKLQTWMKLTTWLQMQSDCPIAQAFACCSFNAHLATDINAKVTCFVGGWYNFPSSSRSPASTFPYLSMTRYHVSRAINLCIQCFVCEQIKTLMLATALWYTHLELYTKHSFSWCQCTHFDQRRQSRHWHESLKPQYARVYE